MKSILFAWLGMTDLRAAEGFGELGPVAQAVSHEQYDHLVLLTDHGAAKTKSYTKWIRKYHEGSIKTHPIKLTSPTDFGEIYEAEVQSVIEEIGKNIANSSLTFHLSPGT